MKLVTYSPLIIEKRERKIPGKIIEEGFLLSSFSYVTRKEGILRRKITDYITKEKYESIDEFLAVLREELLSVWPWLKKLSFSDIEITDVINMRAILYDTEKEEPIEDKIVEVFRGEADIGEFSLGEEEKTKLSNACRSFTEGLASLEWKMIKESISSLSEFYADLKSNWVKKEKFPLRIGYWTDDPYLGWLFSFWRVKEVRAHIVNRLGKDPYPKKILYAPRERATFGWAYVEIR